MLHRVYSSFRSQWAGFLALFVALGGGAVAIGGASPTSAGRDPGLLRQEGRRPGRGAAAGEGQVHASRSERSSGTRRAPPGLRARRVSRDPGEQGPPGPATGPAGGDLSGNYPDPQIANGAVTEAKLGCGQDPNQQMVKVGSFCIDKYEASVWDSPSGGTQLDNRGPDRRRLSEQRPAGGAATNCANFYARSVPGVEPARGITWFQAQQALANSAKQPAEQRRVAAGGLRDPRHRRRRPGTPTATPARPSRRQHRRATPAASRASAPSTWSGTSRSGSASGCRARRASGSWSFSATTTRCIGGGGHGGRARCPDSWRRLQRRPSSRRGRSRSPPSTSRRSRAAASGSAARASSPPRREELQNVCAMPPVEDRRPPVSSAAAEDEPTFHEFASEWFEAIQHEGLARNTLLDHDRRGRPLPAAEGPRGRDQRDLDQQVDPAAGSDPRRRGRA